MFQTVFFQRAFKEKLTLKGHSKGTRKTNGQSGIRRALGQWNTQGTQILEGHSGTRTLKVLGYFGTQAFGHSGISIVLEHTGTQAVRHSDTWVLEHLGTRGTRSTLFSRLVVYLRCQLHSKLSGEAMTSEVLKKINAKIINLMKLQRVFFLRIFSHI